MTDEEKLQMLAAALDRRSLDEQRKTQLLQLLNVAASRLAQTGITLRDDLSDTQLQVDYAAWLYRRRNLTAGPAMPEGLRLDINDRLIHGKAGGGDG